MPFYINSGEILEITSQILSLRDPDTSDTDLNFKIQVNLLNVSSEKCTSIVTFGQKALENLI
jgi:hypothetical protein